MLPEDDAGAINDVLIGGIGIENYQIVSLWSLRIAVRALQRVLKTTTCPSSRMYAEAALKAIGMTPDLSVDGVTMMPEPIVISEEQLRALDPLTNFYTFTLGGP